MRKLLLSFVDDIGAAGLAFSQFARNFGRRSIFSDDIASEIAHLVRIV